MQVIRFAEVYKSYEKAGLALKNVSFDLRKGEFVFLTGPSGAGKSTLLKLIYMEVRPTDGEVRVSGFSSSKIHRREIPFLRRRLGSSSRTSGYSRTAPRARTSRLRSRSRVAAAT